MGKLQMGYRDLFLVIDAEDEFTEPLFVCMNTDKLCWVDVEINTSNLQKNSIIFKGATNSKKVAEFILQNQPNKFQENYHIRVFQSKQEGIGMYFSSNIIRGVAECDFYTFLQKVNKQKDSGITIMGKLKENNPTLYEQLRGRGQADLSDISGKVSILRYSKFHKFIKKNW